MTKTKQLLLVPAVIATGMMSFAGVLIETAMINLSQLLSDSLI